MNEKTICKFLKVLEFKSGEEIKINIELINVDAKQNECIKDFLETMFKEVKMLL